jgi:hypothetical protein
MIFRATVVLPEPVPPEIPIIMGSILNAELRIMNDELRIEGQAMFFQFVIRHS